MKTLNIKPNTENSKIIIGESISNLIQYVPSGKKLIIITDHNVADYYWDKFPTDQIITIGIGEEIKTLETIQKTYDKLLVLEADRNSFICGIGGGIVTDIAGFTASTFMRGIPFGFAATTLLAQVDASVGGKNGVNFFGYKNMIGTITQPEFVISDIKTLKTLPPEELLNGFAEIIKHGCIRSKKLFDYYQTNIDKAKKIDREVLETLIYESVKIKAEIVNKDEKEKGERRILNFGHTIGHGIEKAYHLPHGNAISVGMSMAAEISRRKGYISDEKYRNLLSLIECTGLPVKLRIEPKLLTEAIYKDKKRENDIVHFILLKDIGEAISEPIPVTELNKYIYDLCKY